MNMLGSVSFSVTVSLFYKWKKTIWGALMGLLSGVAVMTAVMLMANLFITPYYMGTTMAAVRELIPALLLPFNLLKGMINAGAVLLLYKPMSRALRKAGILRRSESAVQLAKNGENAPRSATKSGSKLIGLLISVDALALVALAVYLIFNVLNGSFSFGI
jgi:hypothetical protein